MLIVRAATAGDAGIGWVTTLTCARRLAADETIWTS